MSIMFYVPTSIAATGGETGPKMDEIAKWIKKELPPLGTDHIIKKSAKEGDVPIAYTHTINKAILSDCTLTIEQTESPDVTAPIGWATTATIPLKNIDLSKLSSGESATWPGYTQNKPSYVVRVLALPDAPPFGTVSVWVKIKKEEKTVALYIVLRDEAPSHQLEGYLRNAATMCGAPVALTASAPATDAASGAESGAPASAPAEGDEADKPLSADAIAKLTGGSSDAQPGDKEPGNAPRKKGHEALTNKDIIAMVKAELGDKIVIEKINSSPGDKLDTSTDALIRLKKAGVSKAVIDAMIKRGDE
jgi:hypothetical protein